MRLICYNDGNRAVILSELGFTVWFPAGLLVVGQHMLGETEGVIEIDSELFQSGSIPAPGLRSQDREAVNLARLITWRTCGSNPTPATRSVT